MDRKTANREWRDVTRGVPEGAPTGHTVHAFAQRVEALAIAGCDKRHAATMAAGETVDSADMAALRADAERYRWLRDNTETDWAICQWESEAHDGIGYYRDARPATVVDAAIDAAMAVGAA